MIFEIPVLETERFTLRPLSVSDADDVFKWASNEAVARYLRYEPHESTDTSREWLSSLDTLENEYTWGIVRKSGGQLIGCCSMRSHEDGKWWTIGYSLRRDCWNKGCATEVTKRMIAFIRGKYGDVGIYAAHAVENTASGRVMEKCGMHYVRDGEESSFDGRTIFKVKIYQLREEKK